MRQKKACRGSVQGKARDLPTNQLLAKVRPLAFLCAPQLRSSFLATNMESSRHIADLPVDVPPPPTRAGMLPRLVLCQCRVLHWLPGQHTQWCLQLAAHDITLCAEGTSAAKDASIKRAPKRTMFARVFRGSAQDPDVNITPSGFTYIEPLSPPREGCAYFPTSVLNLGRANPGLRSQGCLLSHRTLSPAVCTAC